MSPKKRKRKASGAADGGPQQRTRTGTRTVSRVPVVVDDRRRWPVAVWIAAVLAWLLGSALFFVLYLAEGFAMLGETQISDAARRTTAFYLLGLLGCALLVPLAAGTAAVLLRRRIAAIGFGAMLLASLAVLLFLASPGEFLGAIAGGFG